MGLDVVVFRTPGELAGAADAWDECVRRSVRPTPFMLSAWLLASWRVVHQRAAVVAAMRGGEIVAGLPLAISSEGVHRAHFLAGQHAGLDLVLRQGEDEAGRAVVAATRELGGGYLQLEGMRDPCLVASAARSCGPPIRLDGAPTLSLEGGWAESYARRVGKRRRSEWARRLRRLQDTGAVELRIVRDRDGLHEALDAGFEVHERRWDERDDRDSTEFTSPQQRVFHHDALRGLAELDAARIVLLTVEGTAIAFCYYALLEGTLWGIRQAFDPGWARFSPGILVTLAALEEGAREGATRVEFMRGVQPYKLELADGVEPLYWGIFEPNGLAGTIAAHRRYRELALRQQLKRSDLARRARGWLAPANPSFKRREASADDGRDGRVRDLVGVPASTGGNPGGPGPC